MWIRYFLSLCQMKRGCVGSVSLHLSNWNTCCYDCFLLVRACFRGQAPDRSSPRASGELLPLAGSCLRSEWPWFYLHSCFLLQMNITGLRALAHWILKPLSQMGKNPGAEQLIPQLGRGNVCYRGLQMKRNIEADNVSEGVRREEARCWDEIHKRKAQQSFHPLTHLPTLWPFIWCFLSQTGFLDFMSLFIYRVLHLFFLSFFRLPASLA